MLLLVNVDALGENWWHPLVYQPHPQWAGDLSIHWPVAGILLALATGNSQQVLPRCQGEGSSQVGRPFSWKSQSGVFCDSTHSLDLSLIPNRDSDVVFLCTFFLSGL